MVHHVKGSPYHTCMARSQCPRRRPVPSCSLTSVGLGAGGCLLASDDCTTRLQLDSVASQLACHFAHMVGRESCAFSTDACSTWASICRRCSQAALQTPHPLTMVQGGWCCDAESSPPGAPRPGQSPPSDCCKQEPVYETKLTLQSQISHCRASSGHLDVPHVFPGPEDVQVQR